MSTSTISMTMYQQKLSLFKDLIERYTIADLTSMIYAVEIKDSGACCYPAVQTLFSLMELLGRLLKHNVKDTEAFLVVFTQLGPKYTKETGTKLYDYFRNGIAHTSLAKAGVAVKKTGDSNFHLSNEGNDIDIRIMFEDFLKVFNDIFETKLKIPRMESYYETNLKDLFSSLHIPWEPVASGDLDVSADFTRTYTTPNSNASTTSFKGKLVKMSGGN